MIRVGIAGLGKMGHIRANLLQRFPNAQLTAGTDPAPEAFAQQFPDVQLCADVSEVLDSGIDALLVCTPNCYTAACIEQALDAGKHVLAEKPPGRSPEEVQRIIAAEKRNPGQKLLFGFNHRHHDSVQKAKQVLDSGALGRLLWLRGVYGKAGTADFEQQWRNNKALAGGGILLDQGIHMLDLMHYFCGEFNEVKSMISTACWDIDVEDNAFALLRDARGRIATLHSSATLWKQQFSLELGLDQGYLHLQGILSSTRSYGEETLIIGRRPQPQDHYVAPEEEIHTFATDPSFERELAIFFDYIVHDKPVTEGGSKQAQQVMDLVFAIYHNDA